MRSKRIALLGGGTFLPVHWGTFNLAMHAWDEPAETLFELGPKQGANLLMPRLGEPVEPAHAHELAPWWRAADAREPQRRRETRTETPAITLPKAMPWPFD